MDVSWNLDKVPALRHSLKLAEQKAFSQVKIVHPADTFARTAGYSSWEEILSLPFGTRITGTIPYASKSIIGLQMLSATIKEHNFNMQPDEFANLVIWRDHE